MIRLPDGTRVRKVRTSRCNKQGPGHHIQMNMRLNWLAGFAFAFEVIAPLPQTV
ncbi:hypothetical protein [Rubellimicrobium rubrum]|uniref:hypothetical protein n=1 Tax=Rubellimicrobium rubrum TaxID=2585369 RepID=UPI00159BB7FF